MENDSLLEKIEKLEKEVASLKASRGPRAFFRRALSKSSLILGVIIAAVLAGFLLWAAQITFTDGTVISAADVNANFTELYSKVNCRESFWSLGDGRVCMESSLRGPANYYSAVAVCQALAPGSRVCTENDFLQACGAGFSPLTTSGQIWVGNVAADDEYFITNVGNCSSANILGSSVSAPSFNYYYRCCY